MATTLHKCCGRIYGGSYRGHPCGNTGKFEHDGKWYCGTHDPVRLAAKYDKAEAEREAKWAARIESQAKAEYARKVAQDKVDLFPELVAALEDLMEYAGIIEERCDAVATTAAREILAKARKVGAA